MISAGKFLVYTHSIHGVQDIYKYLIFGFSLSFPSMLNNNFLHLISKQRVFVHLQFREQQQLFKEVQTLNKNGFMLLITVCIWMHFQNIQVIL